MVYKEYVTDCKEPFIPRNWPHLKVEHQHRCPAYEPTYDCPVDRTETDIAMEEGIKKLASGVFRKSAVNFTSFPIIEKFLADDATEKHQTFIPFKRPNTTVYTRDYSPFFHSEKHPCANEKTPHFLANRIPKNSFLMENAYSEHKFMDDHYHNKTPARQCIDFFRQIRMATKMLEDPEDEKPPKNPCDKYVLY